VLAGPGDGVDFIARQIHPEKQGDSSYIDHYDDNQIDEKFQKTARSFLIDHGVFLI
jgi:hypothetical protein